MWDKHCTFFFKVNEIYRYHYILYNLSFDTAIPSHTFSCPKIGITVLTIPRAVKRNGILDFTENNGVALIQGVEADEKNAKYWCLMKMTKALWGNLDIFL